MDGCIWITGGSTGIGRALALRLARSGHRVVVSARSQQVLAEVTAREPTLYAYPLDVTDAAACGDAVAAIEAQYGEIRQAVLNAAYYQPAPLATLTTSLFADHMAVNYQGVVNCLMPLMAAMQQRQRGRIAITASVAGYRGLPASAPYSATKAALINLAESLQPELAEAGIRMQLINPGFVATPLTDKNRFTMPMLQTPEQAAKAIERGLDSGRFEIVFPWVFAMMMKLLRLLPYGVYLRLSRRAIPSKE